MTTREIVHERLASGVQLLAQPMPRHHTVSMLVRIDGGMAAEPEEHLGLAYVIQRTLDKGTERFDARQLADAFDAIGAAHAVHAGRQNWWFDVSVLPEFIERAIELAAEPICRATFPEQAVVTARQLAEQQLSSLEDSPRALLRRRMSRQAYGPILGRHQLGEAETLARIDGEAARALWRRVVRPARLTFGIAGPIDPQRVGAAIDRHFGELAGRAAPDGAPPPAGAEGFRSTRSHIAKDLQQTQIGISFPGTPYGGEHYPTERVLLAVLSGGMSSRLFTEVREKQGLVYWVRAWHEHTSAGGMIHVGAATTPQRCRRTYETLLREIGRLQDDLGDEELERARTGLLAERATDGASVGRKVGEMLIDQFHLGRVVSVADKERALQAVTVEHIQRYLEEHPRDELSIVTVGKEPLEAEATE